MSFQEVILCTLGPLSSQGTGLIALHDIQTGASLASFKQTTPAVHCTSYVETKLGLGGIILTAQRDKALLNVFSFQKDQLILKNVLPEKLCCIAVDSRGEYCAGGTASGRLYIWEIASGVLFNCFEAHYRKLSVLRFTRDGAALISGSDDSGVHVWSTSRLLDEDLQNEIPTPYCSFFEHTLPVTDVLCGVGKFPSVRILTSSIDHSVKLWDLATRTLLTSFLFPQAITVLAMDPSERTFFAGSQDGSIHQVNLFRRRMDVTSSRDIESIGGGGMSDVIQLTDDESAKERLISFGEPVTALSFSLTASLLVAGTSSGQIHTIDVASHQLLRSLNVYKDKGLSITSVATMLRPTDLFGYVHLGDSSATTRDTVPVRAIAPFQRTKNVSSRENHEVPMMMPAGDWVPPTLYVSNEQLLEEHRYFVPSGTVAPNGTSNSNSTTNRVSELELEVADLREALGNARKLNDAMWENVVHKLLTPAAQSHSDTDTPLNERSKKRSRITK